MKKTGCFAVRAFKCPLLLFVFGSGLSFAGSGGRAGPAMNAASAIGGGESRGAEFRMQRYSGLMPPGPGGISGGESRRAAPRMRAGSPAAGGGSGAARCRAALLPIEQIGLEEAAAAALKAAGLRRAGEILELGERVLAVPDLDKRGLWSLAASLAEHGLSLGAPLALEDARELQALRDAETEKEEFLGALHPDQRALLALPISSLNLSSYVEDALRMTGRLRSIGDIVFQPEKSLIYMLSEGYGQLGEIRLGKLKSQLAKSGLALAGDLGAIQRLPALRAAAAAEDAAFLDSLTPKQRKALSLPIEELRLPEGTVSILRRGLRRLEIAADLASRAEAGLLAIPGFGKKRLGAIGEALEKHNLSLGMPVSLSLIRKMKEEAAAAALKDLLSKQGPFLKSLSAEQRGLLPLPVEELEISSRAAGSLRRAGAETVAELISLTEDRVLALPGAGKAAFHEIKSALARHGLSLGAPLGGSLIQEIKEEAALRARESLLSEERAFLKSIAPEQREFLSAPVERLDISGRAARSLSGGGAEIVAELIALTEAGILALPRMGPAGLREIQAALARHGLSLGAPLGSDFLWETRRKAEESQPAAERLSEQASFLDSLTPEQRDILPRRIDRLLSSEASRALKANNVSTVADLIFQKEHSLLSALGPKAVEEIRRALKIHGLFLDAPLSLAVARQIREEARRAGL